MGIATRRSRELKQVVRAESEGPVVGATAGRADAAAGHADVKPSPRTPVATHACRPAKPVDAAESVGNWTATRSDGASFSLDVAKDGTYSWRHTLQGKSQTFSGAYTVADNLLILKEGGNPAMIGQIIALRTTTQFNFKLAGNNPSDPGLTFSKK